MRVEKRLEQLEKKPTPTKPWRAHAIFIDPGGNEEKEIKKFKEENEVGPDDEFTIIQFVTPIKG